MDISFTFHDILLVIAIIICLVSTIQTFHNFFATVARLEQGSAKDFDIYYVPIQIALVISTCTVLYTSVIDFLHMPVSSGCNESLFIFNTSVVGGCYLQIAISWLEVSC